MSECLGDIVSITHAKDSDLVDSRTSKRCLVRGELVFRRQVIVEGRR